MFGKPKQYDPEKDEELLALKALFDSGQIGIDKTEDQIWQQARASTDRWLMMQILAKLKGCKPDDLIDEVVNNDSTNFKTILRSLTKYVRG